MSGEDGGEAREGLAPVIPLFGPVVERSAAGPRPVAERAATGPRPVVERAKRVETARTPAAEPTWNSTWGDDPELDDRADRSPEPDDDERAELAEKTLLRRLRGRSLSISEARAALGAFGIEARACDAILDSFVSRGYLDDAKLAEQLIHSGTDRKGQGRRVIAQTLAKRGIPRDVADAALAELPDDDADRALEFARTKASSMRGLDRDVALRRLAGQLARRGYGSTALDAARRALDEIDEPPAHGVRFR